MNWKDNDGGERVANILCNAMERAQDAMAVHDRRGHIGAALECTRTIDAIQGAAKELGIERLVRFETRTPIEDRLAAMGEMTERIADTHIAMAKCTENAYVQMVDAIKAGNDVLARAVAKEFAE